MISASENKDKNSHACDPESTLVLTVSAWNPNANNGVDALAISGSTVYAGGFFTSIGGQPRSRLAALDAISGLVTAWKPNASHTVDALVVSGNTIYAGGAFSSIGGQTQQQFYFSPTGEGGNG